MSAYLWSEPTSEGMQVCMPYDSGRLITVTDCTTYAILSRGDPEHARPVEHFANVDLAREAGEKYLRECGVSP